MEIQKLTLNEERDVTLTAMLLGTGTEYHFIDRRPAVIIIPGGAYQYCSVREADPVASRFLAAGYQTFILQYSVGENRTWPNPLTDYETAIGLIREKADEWHIYPDKIAVCGFSAGGHLAGAAAVQSLNRPNAAILGYPVANAYIRTCITNGPNLAEEVDDLTPPCFVFATRTDDVVPIQNSLEFTAALAEAGISFESHIYSHGPHGFSTGDSSIALKTVPMASRVSNWMTDALSWLTEVFGDFGDHCMTEPTLVLTINDDKEPFFTAECSIGHLLKNEAARAIVKPLLDESNVGTDHDLSENDYEIIRTMKLHDSLFFSGRTDEFIAEVDAKLRKIPNRKS